MMKQTKAETVDLGVQTNKDSKKNRNRIFTALISFVVFIAITIFVSHFIMEKEFVNEQEVKNIVITSCGSSYDDIREYKCKKSLSDEGKPQYEISFEDSKGFFRVFVDCKTGKINEFYQIDSAANAQNNKS